MTSHLKLIRPAHALFQARHRGSRRKAPIFSCGIVVDGIMTIGDLRIPIFKVTFVDV